MNCAACPSTTGVAVVERLNSKNLRPTRMTLCKKCATKLGYRPLRFERGYRHSLGSEHQYR